MDGLRHDRRRELGEHQPVGVLGRAPVTAQVELVAALLEPERISLRDIELALEAARGEELRSLQRAHARVERQVRIGLCPRRGAST